jgi:hypothetical protein
MTDVVLSDVADNSALVASINSNFDKIETKLNAALTSESSATNTLNATLDVNSQRLINLRSPQSGTDAARLIDVSGGSNIAVPSLTGNAGKYLQTDGNVALWTSVVASGGGAGLNAQDYGIVGDGVADDTAALQAAIDEALSTGQSLYVPPGDYSVTTLNLGSYLTGRIHIYGDPETRLFARTANNVILNLGSGESRLGPKIIRGIKIDGNGLSGITGLKMGDTDRALLHGVIEDVFIKSCAIGFELNNVQESSFNRCKARLCTTGWIIETDVTNGGGTTLLFNQLAAQENYVGMLVKSNSIYPVSTIQFNQPLFQSNYLCGVAFFGAVSSHGAVTATSINVPHFEGNGSGTAEGDTTTVRSCLIVRGAMHLEGSSIAVQGALGESQASTYFAKLRNGSVLDIQGGALNAGDKGVIECDSSSRFTTAGIVNVGGNMDGVADWSGLYIQTGGVRGSIAGTPLVAISQSVPNVYMGAGLLPDAPEAESAIACTPSKVIDAQHGLVQRVTYGATALGYSTTNNVKFNLYTSAMAVNEHIAVSFLVKANAATNMGFYIQGASAQLRGPASIPVTTEWKRVVFFGRVETAQAGGFPMYAYPVGTDSPVVDYAKMMVVRTTATDTTLDAINQMIRLGLYDNMRQPIYTTVAPTTGTWNVGQIVLFRVPTSGGYIGAVCTTAGTPGTWKSFGAIL